MKLLPKMNADLLHYFWSKVSKTKACWNWTGCCVWSGYGRISYKRKRNLRAHRVSYLIHYGIDPLHQLVCHRCDNPKCVNPKHLFLGSHLDNTRDMDQKGRRVTDQVPRGEKQHLARLTEEKVLEIRANKTKLTQRQMAKKYGVGVATISHVVRRYTWKHI